MTNEPATVCTRCVMDTSDPDISFDTHGICNHCREFDLLAPFLHLPEDVSLKRLQKLAKKIKEHGKGREYDCALGVSGGVDSSYVAYLAQQLDLRVLAVHFDNGWNSELSVENIKRIIDKLGVDLHTYVIDWEEFKDLQRSFLKASVVDIEILTDQAIMGAFRDITKKMGIKYILSGANLATESGMPRSWTWLKQDLRNIKAIQKHFGTKKIRSFPTYGLTRRTWNAVFKTIVFTDLLNYTQYRKTDAVELLKTKFGWQPYPHKHYESIFTKFYQAHILPEKFGIDKRKAHLSSLVRNSEITRDAAVAELRAPLYDPTELARDKDYVIGKLGFSAEQFAEIMKAPVKRHNDYPSNAWVLKTMGPLRNLYIRRQMRKASLA